MIDEVLADLDQEMAAVRRGDLEVIGFDLDDLARIRQELTMMQQAMSPKRYAPQYPWAITDRADFAWKLGSKLLDAAQQYEKLK